MRKAKKVSGTSKPAKRAYKSRKRAKKDISEAVITALGKTKRKPPVATKKSFRYALADSLFSKLPIQERIKLITKYT